jgi:hypothetical protein
METNKRVPTGNKRPELEPFTLAEMRLLWMCISNKPFPLKAYKAAQKQMLARSRARRHIEI